MANAVLMATMKARVSSCREFEDTQIYRKLSGALHRLDKGDEDDQFCPQRESTRPNSRGLCCLFTSDSKIDLELQSLW